MNINALVHSAYSYGGSAIKVAFSDDNIWIENPGGLLPGLTVEQITNGVSIQRNPAVARIFREMDMIEAWGTGLRKAVAEIEAEGFGAPRIDELLERLRVTVPIPNHNPLRLDPLLSRNGNSEGVSSNSQSRELGRQDEQVSEQVNREVLTSEQVRLLSFASTPKSRAELLKEIGLSDLYGNYQRHIFPLIELHLLERTIPDKPNSRFQRYITTAEGLAFAR